jgi:molybdopterin molybdotransferase
VLDKVIPIRDEETIPVSNALGRVLARPAIAGFPVPNHDNSAMDGYAVRFADLDVAQPVTLRVVATLPAGDYMERPINPGEAVRIMTGAPIPPGCDCVVMQERITRSGHNIAVPPGQKPGQHIRAAGEDIPEGTVVLPPGRRLKPADLGLMTALGLKELGVRRRVKVALLSTGNEVIETGWPLRPGQVYDSNRSALRGALHALCVNVLDLGLVGDDEEAIKAALAKGDREADAVITTGGVSVGDHDLVKTVLARMGQIDFWQVAMKPGKPQAYGRLENALFFGLPGNPVSGMVVFHTIVRHALLAMMGATPQPDKMLKARFRGSF